MSCVLYMELLPAVLDDVIGISDMIWTRLQLTVVFEDIAGISSGPCKNSPSAIPLKPPVLQFQDVFFP
jgi:hypothetical protein